MNEAMSDRLIGMCVGRGWISPAAGERARSLVRHGLHPEQALIGTGLVDVEQYAQVLEEATGMTFSNAPGDKLQALDSELGDWGSSILLSREGRTCVVGFAEPTPEIVKRVRSDLLGHSLKLEPRVILRSRLPRSNVRPPIHRLARTVSRLADLGEAYRITVFSDGIQFDEYPPSIRLYPSVASALVLHLPRRLGPSWMGERRGGMVGRIASWFRRHVNPFSPHVLDMSDRVREALERPRGLVVLVNPDRRLQDWTRSGSAKLFDARTEEGAERAMHAALSGVNGIAIASDGADRWWETLRDAVPVTTIIRHSEAGAWEVLEGA